MLKRNRWFITVSLGYALVGGGVGIVRLAVPELLPGDVLRLHAHLMLLGFVGMMIYGVGLHVLPRFSGRSLFSERLADAQFWMANAGLLLMAVGWLLEESHLLTIGGVLAWAGMVAFAVNILFTVRLRGPMD